jgi:NAD-dependent SIR2 family protein deacetylase
MDSSIAFARQVVHSAGALLISAGAGIGVDSGLPDFRGAEGFWQAYPAAQKLGLHFEQLANPHFFERDPALAWGFYGHRLNLYRTTTPHGGFTILRRWAEQMPGGYFVFTSNVDGQFQKAGFDEQRIVECHGSLHHLQSRDRCGDQIWPNEAKLTIDESTLRAAEPLPRCVRCGQIARPNVLMFGDLGWIETRSDEQTQRYEAWLASLDRKRIVVIELGAGTGVPTVRLQSEYVARIHGGTLIRINPREPRVPNGHISIPLGSLDALRQIDAALH